MRRAPVAAPRWGPNARRSVQRVSEAASKRPLSAVLERVRREGKDAKALWRAIANVAAKTLIAMQPELALHNARDKATGFVTKRSFQLLG